MTYSETKQILDAFAEMAKAKCSDPEYASSYALGYVLSEFTTVLCTLKLKEAERILADIQRRTTNQ